MEGPLCRLKPDDVQVISVVYILPMADSGMVCF